MKIGRPPLLEEYIDNLMLCPYDFHFKGKHGRDDYKTKTCDVEIDVSIFNTKEGVRVFIDGEIHTPGSYSKCIKYGQCLDDIKEIIPPNELFDFWYDMWKKYNVDAVLPYSFAGSYNVPYILQEIDKTKWNFVTEFEREKGARKKTEPAVSKCSCKEISLTDLARMVYTIDTNKVADERNRNVKYREKILSEYLKIHQDALQREAFMNEHNNREYDYRDAIYDIQNGRDFSDYDETNHFDYEMEDYE